MAKQPDDPVLSGLKKLREGRGLTAGRLADRPAVLSATGTADPTEAYDNLRDYLAEQGNTSQALALQVDFGWNLAELLGRLPSAREVDRLGERRASYADLVGRDVKTLARWSDRALAEFREQLLTDRFDGQLLVTGGVKDRRLTGIQVMRYHQEDTTLSKGEATTYENPQPGPSLPLLLFGFPADWTPQSLSFAVAFLDESPSEAWALVADTVFDIGFGHERTALAVVDGMARCRFEDPSWDQLYGIWWRFVGK